MSHVKVLIVDANPTLRRGMVKLLTRSPQIDPVADAPTVEAALTSVAPHAPDVIVVDRDLLGLHPEAAATRFRDRWQGVSLVVTLSLGKCSPPRGTLPVGIAARVPKQYLVPQLEKAILRCAQSEKPGETAEEATSETPSPTGLLTPDGPPAGVTSD